jgi:DNA-binding response OmpR family regulator
VTGGGRRILLAEDDRFLRKAAAATLGRHGYEVLTASDGEEALAIARAQTPDLILLDLIMPKLLGFEVLKHLKAEPATAAIPVIVLSNLGQDRDVQLAMENGAAAYCVKANISLQELVRQVGDTLGLGGERSAAPPQAPPPPKVLG